MSAASLMAARRNELLNDLIAAVERRLVDNEIPAAMAAIVAADLADHLTDHWGGQMLYIPLEYHRKLVKIELEIWEAYSAGRSYADLARQHAMTESGVRRLVNRVRAKLAAMRQSNQLDMLEPREEI